jgi:hypothetical protein
MSRYVWFHLMAIALAAGLTSCENGKTPPSPPPRPMMTDQQLIQAIRAAAAGGTTPQDAESRVGARAIINTVRPGDRDKLNFGHVELDTEQTSEVPSLQAKDIAYWGRPGTWENPHVVGIAWLAEASVKVFFAVVYPP